MAATLTLQPMETPDKTLGNAIEVPYAPSELSFSKAVQYGDIAIPGLNQPLLQFVRGDAETIAIDLFFDHTDIDAGASPQATGSDVASRVEALAKLVAVKAELHRPPLVKLSWGDSFPATSMASESKVESVMLAVVTAMTRNYVLFDPDGKPLRATVNLALKRYATITQQINAMNLQSADHTRVHIVAEGETLPLIAHDAYDDAGLWRVIADHNRLTDVVALTPGTSLELPPLDQGGRR